MTVPEPEYRCSLVSQMATSTCSVSSRARRSRIQPNDTVSERYATIESTSDAPESAGRTTCTLALSMATPSAAGLSSTAYVGRKRSSPKRPGSVGPSTHDGDSAAAKSQRHTRGLEPPPLRPISQSVRELQARRQLPEVAWGAEGVWRVAVATAAQPKGERVGCGEVVSRRGP